jgi:osmotically-inducible protein OsmY
MKSAQAGPFRKTATSHGSNRMKTDLELRKEVERELESDPSVDAGDIAVAAKNGAVTLTGTVRTYYEKWRAESIAKRIAGVAAVANEITVNVLSERTDSELAEAAALALGADYRVPGDTITVVVRNGWIDMEGQVDYYYQKSAAGSVVRNLDGRQGHPQPHRSSRSDRFTVRNQS